MRVTGMIRFALPLASMLLLVVFARPTLATAAGSDGWLLAGGGACPCVDLYPQAGHRQQVAAQMNVRVFGLSVDGNQTLYAGQQLSDGSYGVAVYPPGSKVPTREIDTPIPGGPSSLVVRSDGTLYVGGGYGQLAEYLPGATQPAETIQVGQSVIGPVGGMAIDPATQDIYLNLDDDFGHIYFDILYRVSADLATVSAIRRVPYLGTVSLAVDDRSNLLVGLRHGIGVYANGGGTLTRYFGRDSEVTALAYDSAHDLLYVGGAPGISVYQYSTGRLVNTITAGWGPNNTPGSLALDPARP